MNVCITFFYQFLLSTAIIIFFYFYVKSYIFFIAPKIAFYLQITKHNAVETAKGVIELLMVVLVHIVFSIILIWFLAIPITMSGFTLTQIILYIPVGILLGIGMMGFSSLLCRATIEILRYISKPYFPQEVKDWLIMTRSGWLRHYLHTIDVLSLPLALSVVFGQICCEEMVFRGVFLHYFLPAGSCVALFAATVLFMFMQLFHMPNLVSGIFPLIGSMIIGVFNGILYLKYSNLFPLIMAHFSFFVVAVL